MDHKDKYKYKHKTDSVEDIKGRRSQEIVSLRKDKREKLISSKRFRHDEAHTADHGFTDDLVKETVEKLKQKGTAEENKQNLELLRQICGVGEEFIDVFFSIENSLQCIVGYLTGNNAELQQEAAWCLTNVTAGSHDHAVAVTKMAAPYMVTFLSSSNQLLQDQCAWALGNIAGDGEDCRTLLCAQGAIPPLVKLLQSPVPAVVQSSSFALSNLTMDSPQTSRDLVTAGILELLPPLLNTKPEYRNILAEISWLLTNLSTSGEHVPAMVEKGLLTAVVDLVVKLSNEQPHDAQVVTPLLRCLGNICSGPDEYSTQASENPRLLHSLGLYLDSSVRHIVKEVLWVFSNMAGEPLFAECIVVGPLLEKITGKLSEGFDVKHEALYVLNNIACHGPEACDSLLEHHVLQSVIPILKSHDVEILNLSLGFCEMILRLTEAGYNIFEKFEGVARLEGLEYHSNSVIAAKAHELLDTYFLIEKETDTGADGDK